MLTPTVIPFLMLAAYGPGPTSVPDDVTVWWRTQGAEVIESHNETGKRICSLILHRESDVMLFMWRQNGGPTLFVRHAGWNFGDQQGATTVEIAVGTARRGAQPADSVTAQLPAEDYRDWIRTRLDQTMAEVLPTEGEIRIEFPGSRFSSVSFAIDQARMPNVMRGLDKCKTSLGLAG